MSWVALLSAAVAAAAVVALWVTRVRGVRAVEAVRLECEIAHSLRSDPGLGALPLGVTVRLPFRRGRCARVHLFGWAWSEELRERAIVLAALEAARGRRRYTVTDRIEIVPGIPVHTP